VIVSGWRIGPIAWLCVAYGLLEAAQIRMQLASGMITELIPVQIIQTLPYLVTILALIVQRRGAINPPRELIERAAQL
jgi:ABC-type uncharacterized transport system permease subunit